MNPCKSKQEYLDQIIKPAQRVCKRYGYLPSVLIDQACLENGYGMAKDCYPLIQVNNMVGQKSELLNKSWTDIGLSVWPGKSITKNTPEQYGNQIVRINDNFRVFDSIEQSLADFLLFLTYASNSGAGGAPKYGGEVLSIKDPEALIRSVGGRGYATGQTYPTSVMRIVREHNLTQYDDITTVAPTDQIPPALQKGETAVNSPLVSYTKLSPCNSGRRTMSIDRITPHCVVGQLSVETIGACFDHSSAQASCNYGIGSDGRVMLCVPENVRSWCSSSSANDQRAVTIECASDKNHPYAFKDVVYQKLIDLCVDICKRNGKTKLLWFGDKEKTLAYRPANDEMILTVHRWFANKACPGDWLYQRIGDLAAKVTAALGGSFEPSGPDPIEDVKKLYRVQVGAYQQRENAERKLRQISATGTDCFITELQEGFYRVQCGAYSIRQNAENKANALQYMGFDAIIKEYDVA
jgi:hypothetical protein